MKGVILLLLLISGTDGGGKILASYTSDCLSAAENLCVRFRRCCNMRCPLVGDTYNAQFCTYFNVEQLMQSAQGQIWIFENQDQIYDPERKRFKPIIDMFQSHCTCIDNADTSRLPTIDYYNHAHPPPRFNPSPPQVQVQQQMAPELIVGQELNSAKIYDKQPPFTAQSRYRLNLTNSSHRMTAGQFSLLIIITFILHVYFE